MVVSGTLTDAQRERAEGYPGTKWGFPSLAVIHGQLSLPTLMNQRVQNFLFMGFHDGGTTASSWDNEVSIEKEAQTSPLGTLRTPLPSHIHPMWFPNGMTRVVLATMPPAPPAQPRDPPPSMVSMPLPLIG